MRLAALAAVLLLLPACTPLFWPPVPQDALVAEPAWRLAGDARLSLLQGADGRPLLRATARLLELPRPGWLSVQWYGPSGGERASEARWMSEEDVGRLSAWLLPADVQVVPGPWRVLLSADGRPLRQLDLLVQEEP